jgi:hypothetical protein
VLRALLLITGLALVRWLGVLLLLLLGYRHQATLRLEGAALELAGRRSLLGLDLGSSLTVMPLRRVRRVALLGHSRAGLLVAAAGALLGAAVVGTTLVMWGSAGMQLSWVLLGLCIIGLGVLLDALAYLAVRRATARDEATLVLVGGGLRMRLSGVPAGRAEALVRSVRGALER